MLAGVRAQLLGCSISAPVRGDVSSEASVVGTGAACLGGIEPSPDAAEGIVLVIGSGKVLRALAAGHTFLVLRGQNDDPPTTPRSAVHDRSVVSRLGFRACAPAPV